MYVSNQISMECLTMKGRSSTELVILLLQAYLENVVSENQAFVKYLVFYDDYIHIHYHNIIIIR